MDCQTLVTPSQSWPDPNESGGRASHSTSSRVDSDQEDEDMDNDANTSKGFLNSSAQGFTPRSLIVGLIIGTLITFSNTYFGLQTGWISSMAMPSSLIGFAIFKALSKHLSFPFTPIENVLIQTVAGAAGTMPLGCGFIGVIPALEFLLQEGEDGPLGDGGKGEGGPLKLGSWKLVIWSFGVCLFGVVFAVPLRKAVIVREKLKFPSGTATALMIKVLHGDGHPGDVQTQSIEIGAEAESESLLQGDLSGARNHLLKMGAGPDSDRRKTWKAKLWLLIGAFVISAVYTLFSYFVPQLRDIPILGLSLANTWLWTLNPSPAYIGQGIIMGASTSLHMLVGAIIGWGILSPLAKYRGWAPGPIDDWENGSKGWIVWVSLAIMLADSTINLGWLIIRSLVPYSYALISKLELGLRNLWHWKDPQNFTSHPGGVGYSSLNMSLTNSSSSAHNMTGSDKDDAPPSQLVSGRTVIVLLPLTLMLNVVCMHFAFGNIISPFLSSLATLLALLLSIMGVRALGETDLNPVSGISKLTQLVFALATPATRHTRRSAIVTNLLAGAVSESGALQAGDMMQDLKTGHLIGASPKAQFYGQLVGSLFGAVISTAVYKMYVNVYNVPGSMFQVPTAYVWIFTARLVTGQGLPPMAWRGAIVAGAIYIVLTILRIVGISGGMQPSSPARWRAWIPGGIAVAVGIYNVPSFTLARAIGGVIAWWWSWRRSRSHHYPGHSRDSTSPDRVGRGRPDDVDDDEDYSSSTLIILASGLILGEGVVSIINLILASARVPHL